jgi:hypothetical protein
MHAASRPAVLLLPRLSAAEPDAWTWLANRMPAAFARYAPAHRVLSCIA